MADSTCAIGGKEHRRLGKITDGVDDGRSQSTHETDSGHHCKIIKRHNLMTFDSFVFLADVCLVSKVMNDLAAPTFN